MQLQLIIAWSVLAILFFWWLKLSYVPYREGKISVVMYGESFYTGLLGVAGKAVERWTGKVIDSDKRKGMLWGLLPGAFFPWPFFHMKRDIPLVLIEKKTLSEVKAEKGEVIMFQTGTTVGATAITHREVITDYILYQNTYFFGFGDLETGNDALLSTGDDAQQLEHLDIIMFLGDKIVITNVKDYIFREDNWVTPKENLFKSVIREIAIGTTYKKLQRIKTETGSLMVGNQPLADYMNAQMDSFNLGNNSIDINIDDIHLGKNSAAYKSNLDKRAAGTLLVDIARFDATAAIERLRANKEALKAIQEYKLALMQQVDATAHAKWNLIQASRITHFFESNGKPVTEENKDELIKLIEMLIPKPAASAA